MMYLYAYVTVKHMPHFVLIISIEKTITTYIERYKTISSHFPQTDIYIYIHLT